MRRTKWPLAPSRFIERSTQNGIDRSGLDRLPLAHWRQYAGEPLCKHALAGSRRAAHEDVVPAGGGDLERTFRHCLSLDLGEIGVCRIASRIRRPPYPLEFAGTTKKRRHLEQASGNVGLAGNEARFGAVVFWHDDRVIRFRGFDGRRQDPGHRPNVTVQGEFAVELE